MWYGLPNTNNNHSIDRGCPIPDGWVLLFPNRPMETYETVTDGAIIFDQAAF